MDTSKNYKQVPHTADLAAHISGETLEELFENAALCMFDMMCDLDDISGEIRVDIGATSIDEEGLLVAWLNELLFRSFEKNVMFNRFKIEDISNKTVKGKAFGGHAGPNMMKREIKAATYHDLKIIRKEDQYEVMIVFDV